MKREASGFRPAGRLLDIGTIGPELDPGTSAGTVAGTVLGMGATVLAGLVASNQPNAGLTRSTEATYSFAPIFRVNVFAERDNTRYGPS